MVTTPLLTFDTESFGTDTCRIPWDQLVAVGIRTTAAGPYFEDVFWQFLLEDKLFELPGACVTGDAVGQLHDRLPGIDSAKIVEAMGSTGDRIFRIWHAQDSLTPWQEERFADRYAALIARLGGSAPASGGAFGRLRDRWASGERRYHDLEHLADCMRELDGAAPAAGVADRVELALWYHDAVYVPRRRDNEERSAQLLIDDAAALGIPQPVAAAAAALVRATDHAAPAPAAGDLAADLVHDVDLSILARDPLRFMDFEYAIAEEYACSHTLVYSIGRGCFLASLLEAPAIYRTAHFRERDEARARRQIAALLSSPRYRGYRWLRWLCGARMPATCRFLAGG